MKHYFSVALKLLCCYLVSGAAYLLFIKWPHWEGHAHIPLSGFPEFLIMAPLAPYLMIDNLMEFPGDAAPGALVFFVSFAVAFWILFKWRKSKSRDQ